MCYHVIMIIDSHCHIYDEKLNEVRNSILFNLANSNQLAVCCADNLKNSKKCLKLATNNKNIFAGVGVHPECVQTFNNKTISSLKKLAQENNKVVAIGEIGLDYHYDNQIANTILTQNNNLQDSIAENNNNSQVDITKINIQNLIEENHKKQKEILIKQIKLAQKLNLPCIFHVRDCTGDFLDLLNSLKQEYLSKLSTNTSNNLKLKSKKEDNYKIKGVVHSFSGSLEVAQIYIKYGLYLGINGVVTFKNAKNLVEIVNSLPLENLLIETDSPYLTPEPYRGQINRPEYVLFVAQKIAQIKGLSTEEVVKKTSNNAKNLFNLNF